MTLELMVLFSLVQVTLDLGVLVQSVHFGIEHILVGFNLLGCLGTNMSSYVLYLLSGE